MALATLLGIALGAAGVAGAQTPPAPLPVGTDGHGVRMVKRGGRQGIVVTFSAAAAARYRKIAGRDVDLNCTRAPRPALPGSTVTESGSTSVHVPRRRKPIVTGERSKWDYCQLVLPRRKGPDFAVATVPLTQAGAELLDERATASLVLTAVELLTIGKSPSAVVQHLPGGVHGVTLPSPSQMPPPGVLGVFSDGAAHVYAAKTDHAGKLLFFEQDGDVTRTNLARYVIDPSLLTG